MVTTFTRSMWLAFVCAMIAPAVAGCDKADKPGAATGATQPGGEAGGTGTSAGAAAKDECPTEAQVQEVIGSPVKRLKGFGCSYQSADGKTDVSIMIAGAGSAEQLLKEMRESAAPYPDAKVEPVTGIGEKAHMFAVPGRATCLAVAGSKSYWVEISSPGGGGATDRKPQVMRVMRLLIR